MDVKTFKELLNAISDYAILYEKGRIIFVNQVLKQAVHDNDFVKIRETAIQEGKKIHKIIQGNYTAEIFEVTDHEKLGFLKILSHELNTPMTCILGYLELIMNNVAGEMSSNMAEFIEIIHRNCMVMSDKVNRLIDISSLEDINIVNEQASPEQIITELMGGFLAAAEKKMVYLDYHIDENVLPVVTDVSKLKKIISELLTNSIKNVSPYGSVILNVHQKTETVIEVIDDGPGIPAEKQQVIFSLFSQLEQGSARRVEGMGTGLYFIKNLADLLGIRIEISAPDTGGTCFALYIPSKES